MSPVGPAGAAEGGPGRRLQGLRQVPAVMHIYIYTHTYHKYIYIYIYIYIYREREREREREILDICRYWNTCI